MREYEEISNEAEKAVENRDVDRLIELLDRADELSNQTIQGALIDERGMGVEFLLAIIPPDLLDEIEDRRLDQSE